MPARLVYAPKAYVYTEQQSGAILDLSQFVVAGEVQRKVNQVSYAMVTLRNPHRKFTSPNSPDGTAFHPMDPITIYLERIKDYPVRVFTGYLDTTPYFQLYPQTITLKASCTLKRLIHTWFDPSLPFVYSLFEKYGWVNMQDGTMINTTNINKKVDPSNKNADPNNTLNDSSLAKMLWAALYDIGQWQDSNIYIENLPADLVAKVATLASNLKTAEDQAVSDFEGFLKAVIGFGTQGSGGGSSGGGGNTTTGSTTASAGGGQVTSTLLNSNQRTFGTALSSATGLDTNVVGAWIHAEEPASASGAPNGANNWLNIGAVDSGAWKGGTNPIWSDAQKAGAFTAKWMTGTKLAGYGTAAPGIQRIIATANKSPQDQMRAIQTSGWASSGYPSLPSIYQSIVSSSRKQPTAARGTKSNTATKTATTSTQAGHTAKPKNHGPGNTTVIDALVSAATSINNKNYPYAWGGGHEHAGTPSTHPPHQDGSGTPVLGYDCSGSTGAVLQAAHIVSPGSGVPVSGDFGTWMPSDPGPGSGNPECTIFYNSGHVFMRLNGKMFGTGANAAGGPGWHDHSTSGFNVVHIPVKKLNEWTTYAPPSGTGAGATAQVTQPSAQSMPLPQHDYGRKRKASDIKLIVLHDSEIAGGSGYFSGLVNALNTGHRIGRNADWDPPGVGLSVQCGINSDGKIARLMPDLNIPFGAVGANAYSVQIEQAGFSTDTTWPAPMIDSCAKQVAYWCSTYNIPVKHNNQHGICRHKDLGAFGGDHNDPPDSYPFDQVLQKAQTIISQAATTGSSGSGNNTSGGGANDAAAAAYANAFVSQLELPSIMDQVTARLLGNNHMGLMHDQQLLPFIQQIATACMRNFQSLPNGDFYAFYPDYFGEFGHHDPYWLIDDIEILNGEINLSDDALATHVYAVGDTTWPQSRYSSSSGGIDVGVINMLRAGVIDIQNAFGDAGILSRSGSSPIMSADEAVQFIERYGARPLVQQYPMVRSTVFEMFLAYQQFMLAWSNQFLTPFTFTFMPELYPGGKVGFPAHGLQMYINSVTHTWDYAEAGFTTTAELTAPSIFGNNTQELPPNMVEAMIEPIKKTKAKTGNAKSNTKTKAVAQQVVDETISSVTQAATNILSVFDLGQANASDVNAATGANPLAANAGDVNAATGV